MLRKQVGDVVGRRDKVGDDVDAHGRHDERHAAEDDGELVVDLGHDLHRVHDHRAEHLGAAGGHDHHDDREQHEVHRQAEEVADLHLAFALREAREVAEIE